MYEFIDRKTKKDRQQIDRKTEIEIWMNRKVKRQKGRQIDSNIDRQKMKNRKAKIEGKHARIYGQDDRDRNINRQRQTQTARQKYGKREKVRMWGSIDG